MTKHQKLQSGCSLLSTSTSCSGLVPEDLFRRGPECRLPPTRGNPEAGKRYRITNDHCRVYGLRRTTPDHISRYAQGNSDTV